MKKHTMILLALGLAAAPLGEAAWEDGKKRLKPLTDDTKAKVLAALPAKATVKPKKPRRILVFYRCETFVHGSIVAGNFAMQELGRKTGAFTADLADDYAVFNKANLKKYDAILFNNTTSLALENDNQRNGILDFMSQGKGVAGIHAASDNFYKWKAGARMIGGQFNGHPWGGGGTWSFKLDDPKHLLNQAFKGKGFWHKDEIYQYKPETYVGGDKLRVLVSLDLNTEQTMKPLNRNEGLKKQYTEGGRTVPVSWIRTFEGGRVFYTNLGHNASTYWNPAVLQHYLDGLQYALGDLRADATPSSEITREEVLAPPAP
jgi:type 1 glutamine amidotransferase